MLRTRLAKSYIKRTIRPIYGWTQTTPKSCYLDPAWDRSVPLYPGMGYEKTSGDNVRPASAAASIPYGLGALYVGGDGIDEVLDSGINAFAVWVLGPDAEFEILAPAFDPTQTWTDPGDGTITLVTVVYTGSGRGQLVPTGTGSSTTKPIAKLLKVNSPTKITIGGLTGTF